MRVRNRSTETSRAASGAIEQRPARKLGATTGRETIEPHRHVAAHSRLPTAFRKRICEAIGGWLAQEPRGRRSQVLWPTEWNLAPPPLLGHAARSSAPVPQRGGGPASIPPARGLLRRGLGRSRNRARNLVRGRGRVGRRLQFGARVLRYVGEIGRQSWRPNGRRFGGQSDSSSGQW